MYAQCNKLGWSLCFKIARKIIFSDTITNIDVLIKASRNFRKNFILVIIDFPFLNHSSSIINLYFVEKICTTESPTVSTLQVHFTI